MTAEIVISNKSGIVLAADSAVTLSGNGKTKVYNSARKLFSVDGHDVGLMTYGSANLSNVPIDIIFKLYADYIRNENIDTLDGYVEKFINFVENEKILQDPIIELNYISKCISFILNWIKNNNPKIKKQNSKQLTVEITEESFYESVGIFEKLLDRRESVYSFENIESYITEKYYNKTFNMFKNSFPNIKCEGNSELILNLLIKFIKKDLSTSSSGIVIAGYGKKDYFPSHHNINFSGIINGHLRILSHSFTNINNTDKQAEILPLAQTDVVETIIHGINPRFVSHILDTLNNNSLTTEQQNNIKNTISKYQQDNFTKPMNEIVKVLPLEEVADVASTLINLTSFKRKFSNVDETVGGPIDVLVISKLDGPVWIDRKHYFDIDNNLGFHLKKGGYYN